MAQQLDPVQTIDATILEIIFVENGVSCILKRFIVDRMFSIERRMLNRLRGLPEELMGEGGNARQWAVGTSIMKKESVIEMGPHYDLLAQALQKVSRGMWIMALIRRL